jgi:hypothetical protein
MAAVVKSLQRAAATRAAGEAAAQRQSGGQEGSKANKQKAVAAKDAGW